MQLTRNITERRGTQQATQIDSMEIGISLDDGRGGRESLHALVINNLLRWQMFKLRNELCTTRLGDEVHIGIEGTHTTTERACQHNLARRVGYREHLLGQIATSNAREQHIHILLVGGELLQINRHTSTLDIGQTSQIDLAVERTSVAKGDILGIHHHIGNSTLHIYIGISKRQIPIAQVGSKIGDIVCRDSSAIEFALDGDIVDEVLVGKPIIALDLQRAQTHIGVTSHNLEVL